MNSSKALYTTLNALIFLVILVIGVMLIFTGLSIAGFDFDFVKLTDTRSISEISGLHYLLIGLNLILYLVFIYGLIKLRTVASLFLNNTYYDPELGKNIDLSGKSFVLTGIFWWIVDGLSSFFLNHHISIGVSEKTFVYLFIIVIGLFFILAGKLFDNAYTLKSENDLTI